MRHVWLAALVLGVVGSLFLGCSSGGSSTAVVEGTAATGAPIAGETVTLRDSRGVEVTGVTGSDGKFVLPVTGLTPPFLIRVSLPGGGVVYGVGFASGVSNVHPVTDLIVQSFFEAQGLDLSTEFDNFGPTSVAPTDIEIDELAGILEDALELSLDNTIPAGERDEFNFFTTPFDADSTGFDLLLDNSTTGGGAITVTLVDSTQTTTINVDNTTRTIDFTTDTTTPSGTSSGSTSFSLPAPEDGDALTAAKNSVEQSIQTLAAAITNAGSGLTPATLEPFFDEQYLDNGEDRAEVTTSLAEFAGAMVTSNGVDSVKSFDPDNGIISVEFSLTATDGQQTGSIRVGENGGFAFKEQGDGSWLGYGNQRIARIELQLVNAREYTGATTSDVTPRLRASARAPLGTLSSATLTGTFPPNDFATTVDLADSSDNEQDYFDLGGDLTLSEFPPAGSAFDFELLAVNASEVTVYTEEAAASTTEAIEIVSYNGTNRDTFFTNGLANGLPGSTLTVVWTLPVSFTAAEIEFRVSLQNANGDFQSIEVDDLDATATSASVDIPTSFGGFVVTEADVVVEVFGADGQVVSVREPLTTFAP